MVVAHDHVMSHSSWICFNWPPLRIETPIETFFTQVAPLQNISELPQTMFLLYRNRWHTLLGANIKSHIWRWYVPFSQGGDMNSFPGKIIYIYPCWHSPTNQKTTSYHESIHQSQCIPRLVCDFYIPRKLGDFKASQPKVGGHPVGMDPPDQATGAPGWFGWFSCCWNPDAKNMGGFVSKSWFSSTIQGFAGQESLVWPVPLGKKCMHKFPPRKTKPWKNLVVQRFSSFRGGRLKKTE